MRIGHTHTHTKSCKRNNGERREEDKAIEVYKKFPLKLDPKLTLIKDTCVPIHYMEAHRGSGLQLHSFLTSSLEADAWLVSRSGRFAPGHRTLVEDWSDARSCVPGFEPPRSPNL